jgi:D-alanyl-D-alanine carboxypeptidase
VKTRARLAALIVSLACVVAGAPVLAQSPTPTSGGPPTINAASAILVSLTDADQILFTRNANQRRAPASLTKVVTALVARDEYTMDEVVTADPVVLNTHGSDLGLEPGMQITVRDLLYALMLKSANDSAMALAAHHPAGYEHFIQLMNEKARSLGAFNSQFRNPHGLDQDGHYSSAHDMAIFTRAMATDPVLGPLSGTPRHTMIWKGRERLFGHHHDLVRTNPTVLIGGKTGFTNQAGQCLISIARTPAGSFAIVLMGAGNTYGETLSLIEYGKTLYARRGAGGGSIEGFGRLPGVPVAPDIDLPFSGVDVNDPRDDLRWPLLMMALALIAAGMLLQTRRRQQPAAVDVWLARLSAEQRRRR